jgi:hypothetical protein
VTPCHFLISFHSFSVEVSQDLVFIPIKNEGGREGGDLCGFTVILLDVNGKISLQFVCAVCFSVF